MAFPTLSRRYLDIKKTLLDNVIIAEFEGNYEHRRKRSSRDRTRLAVIFDLLDDTDRDALLSHYATVGLYTSFTFTDNDSISYTVYYEQAPSWDRKHLSWNKFQPIQMVEV